MTNVWMNADDCSIMNLDLDFQDITQSTVDLHEKTDRRDSIECLLKQTKHGKTSIQLQVFPNPPAIRAQMLCRNVETLFRVAMPSLIQLGPFSSCWASQVSDLGLTS